MRMFTIINNPPPPPQHFFTKGFKRLLKKPLAALLLLPALVGCGSGSGGSRQAITEQSQPQPSGPVTIPPLGPQRAGESNQSQPQPSGPITIPAVSSSTDQDDDGEQQKIIVGNLEKSDSLPRGMSSHDEKVSSEEGLRGPTSRPRPPAQGNGDFPRLPEDESESKEEDQQTITDQDGDGEQQTSTVQQPEEDRLERERQERERQEAAFSSRYEDSSYETKTYVKVGKVDDFSYWLEDKPNNDLRALSVEFLNRNERINPTPKGKLRKNFLLPHPISSSYIKNIDNLNSDIDGFETNLSNLRQEYNTLESITESSRTQQQIARLETLKLLIDNARLKMDSVYDEIQELSRRVRKSRINASYNKRNGFVGTYIYKGEVGNFQSDVNLKFNHWPNRYNELGNRSSELRKPYISGTIGNDLVMGGDEFHGFIIHSELDVENGVFEVTPQFGYGGGIIHSDGSQQGQIAPNVSSGTGTIKGVLSNDGTKGHSADALPNYLAGEVKVTGFSKNGESGEGNQLVGVFVGEKQ